MATPIRASLSQWLHGKQFPRFWPKLVSESTMYKRILFNLSVEPLMFKHLFFNCAIHPGQNVQFNECYDRLLFGGYIAKENRHPSDKLTLTFKGVDLWARGGVINGINV